MTGPSGRPTTVSALLAIVAALGAAWSVLQHSLLTMGLGVGGALLVSLGVIASSRDLTSAGVFLLVVGSLLASLAGDDILAPVLGTTGALLAWHFGENAISLGGHVGRQGATRRQELAVGMVGLGLGGVAVLVVMGAGRLPLPTLTLPGLILGGFAATVLAAGLAE